MIAQYGYKRSGQKIFSISPDFGFRPRAQHNTYDNLTLPLMMEARHAGIVLGGKKKTGPKIVRDSFGNPAAYWICFTF